MSDVLFRYLLMAQRREGGRLRHLFFARRGLLTAGVEQLVEAAVSRVEVRSQHEVVSHEDKETPASGRHDHTFYSTPQPVRPQPHHFMKGVQRFPLRSSLQVGSCGTCTGSGKVPCKRCGGVGRTRCGSCGGEGFKGSGSKREICGRCDGSGRRSCRRCKGSGKLRCERCDGEGRLANWTVEIYTHSVLQRSQDGYPTDGPSWRLRRACTRLLDRSEAVESLETPVVEAHLGYSTSAARQVAYDARMTVIKLEGEARTARGACLFVQTHCFIEPLGYTVLRLRGRPQWYWLIGRGADATEVAPLQLPSPVRLLVWLLLLASLGSVVLVGQLVVAAGMVSLATGWPLWLSLMGCCAGSAGLTAVLGRLSAEPNPVRTLVVVRPGRGPSPLLPVLASMGSHVGALSVTDRNYTVMMDALRGLLRDDRQSLSLSVDSCDGLRVRFVELARPASLTDAQCSALMRAVDGVIFLQDDVVTLPTLRQRLETVDGARAQLIDLPLQYGEHWEDGKLPLERMQRAFINTKWDDSRWLFAFRDLWSHFEPALHAPAPDPSPPPALTGPVAALPVQVSPTSPASEKLSPMRRLLQLLFPRRQQTCKVPILGVEGSGKSSLIVTLGQYVSLFEHGRIPEDSQALFGAYLPAVMDGRPLRATVRHTAFSVVLSRVPEKDGSHTDVDLVLSSEDIPGQDFRMLVNELTRNPELTPSNEGAGAIVKRFGQLLSDCDGFIFVVDLMRSSTPAQFAADPRKQIWSAYSDQVKPIMTGILLAARHNASLQHKPMFFVFSKPDLHGLSKERLEEDFRRAMAIPLGALRALDVRTRLYSVQCAGWNMDTNLAELGIDTLISDLAHSVGAARKRD